MKKIFEDPKVELISLDTPTATEPVMSEITSKDDAGWGSDSDLDG